MIAPLARLVPYAAVALAVFVAAHACEDGRRHRDHREADSLKAVIADRSPVIEAVEQLRQSINAQRVEDGLRATAAASAYRSAAAGVRSQILRAEGGVIAVGPVEFVLDSADAALAACGLELRTCDNQVAAADSSTQLWRSQAEDHQQRAVALERLAGGPWLRLGIGAGYGLVADRGGLAGAPLACAEARLGRRLSARARGCVEFADTTRARLEAGGWWELGRR